jgi:cholinesterase
MTGYNLNETAYISPPIWTNDEFVRDVLQLFPNMTNTTVSYITTVMYPDILDGTHGYITEAGRERLFRAELFLTCNTRYLALASHNQTYGYRFQYPPGVHEQDIDFTFFNGGSSIPNYGATVDPTISHAMQDYFVRFSMTGNPNGGGLPPWPIYGSNSTLLTFGMEGIGTDVDGNANGRCAYWWTGAYLNS